MQKFSERYGYIQPSDALIVDSMPQEIINAICNIFEIIRNITRQMTVQGETYYRYMEQMVWTKFLNQRYAEFYDVTRCIPNDIITSLFLDKTKKWFEKLDLLEFCLAHIHKLIQYEQDKKLFNRIVTALNSEFSRLYYGYRIVDKLVTPISSETEISSLETAITNSTDSVKVHLNRSLELFSDRESPDYRNSIKESISAVELVCRNLTGKNTLGEAIKELENKGVLLQSQFKQALINLYSYTNQKDTGIRHSLIDSSFVPTQADAHFMLVACSAFINYIRELSAKTTK